MGIPFFKSMSQGWMTYYGKSSGPKFTEEQVRMSDDVSSSLVNCFPIQKYIDPITHSEICKNLRNGKFTAASLSLENGPPELDISKTECLEALKIGIWLLGTCAPQSIRLATLNLLACDYYFPIG